MPNVMAHPAVGEELDLEEIVARFEEEGDEAEWSEGDGDGDDWGEDEDLDEDDDWDDDDEWDEDEDEDWDSEDDWGDDEEEDDA